MKRFDIYEFIAADPAEIVSFKAHYDFLRLGGALAKAVGFELNEDKVWAGQERRPFHAIYDGRSLTYNPNGIFGFNDMVEQDVATDQLLFEAMLPVTEYDRSGPFTTPHIGTNIGGRMDVVWIPLHNGRTPSENITEEQLTLAYSTTQKLTRDILGYYGLLPPKLQKA